MNLPEFPTDEATLDMIMLSLDPGPEEIRTSLGELLELMSQMGGSDTTAVSEVLHVDPRDDDPYESRGDQPEWGPEIHVMRDPIYHDHDVIRALIKELREVRAQVDIWELTYSAGARAINRALNIDPEAHATKSRDYGRGFADAIRRVHEALESDA